MWPEDLLQEMSRMLDNHMFPANKQNKTNKQSTYLTVKTNKQTKNTSASESLRTEYQIIFSPPCNREELGEAQEGDRDSKYY